MTKEERIERARKYEPLRDLWNEFLDDFEENAMKLSANAKRTQGDLREGLYDAICIARIMKDSFNAIVTDGEMAKSDLKRMAKQKKQQVKRTEEDAPWKWA